MKILLQALLLCACLVPFATYADKYSNRDGRGSHHSQRDHDRSITFYESPRRRSGFSNFNNNFSVFNTFGVGIGYSTFGGNVFLNHGYPYSPWSYRNSRPVIVEHHTYIEHAVPRTGVNTISNRPFGKSLLRDLEGRCFEREIDAKGNEIRTELDAAACDF